ncbi:MAG: 8-oxo-dGTP diphosphatase [Blastochloris sp.]|nr:8-oxo-dGTP diphosphatase [Blastochloris sp.]
MEIPVWSEWVPGERAVLCFIVREGSILLIEKKRGLGAGKVNGPGGRMETGETREAAARRETEEEVGLTPLGLSEAGCLAFQFTDGYALHCTVFRAEGYEGEMKETEEAKPFWVSVAEIPYERMWADDIYWMPHLLEGRKFEGRFVFDEDRMLYHSVEVEPGVAGLIRIGA